MVTANGADLGYGRTAFTCLIAHAEQSSPTRQKMGVAGRANAAPTEIIGLDQTEMLVHRTSHAFCIDFFIEKSTNRCSK